MSDIEYNPHSDDNSSDDSSYNPHKSSKKRRAVSTTTKKSKVKKDAEGLKPAALLKVVAENQPSVAPEKHAWVCDVCKDAYFPTYEEALEHEVTCGEEAGSVSDFKFCGSNYVKHVGECLLIIFAVIMSSIRAHIMFYLSYSTH